MALYVAAMQPWHLTVAAVGRHTLFPERAALTRAVRALARVTRGRMLTFCLVDDHAHVVVNAPTRANAGYVGGVVSRALSGAGAPALQPTHVREVDGRRHLEHLVGYLVLQPARHGLSEHPAVWVGGAAVDLLGARVVPGFEPTALAAALPRLDVPAHVARLCGLPRFPEVPIEALSPEASWQAALAAGAVLPGERDRHAVAMCTAWASVAPAAGPIAGRTFRRRRGGEVDPRLLAALRRRVALDALVARAPAPRRAESWSDWQESLREPG